MALSLSSFLHDVMYVVVAVFWYLQLYPILLGLSWLSAVNTAFASFGSSGKYFVMHASTETLHGLTGSCMSCTGTVLVALKIMAILVSSLVTNIIKKLACGVGSQVEGGVTRMGTPALFNGQLITQFHHRLFPLSMNHSH